MVRHLRMVALLTFLPTGPLAAQQPAPACAEVPLLAALDFWVGEWTVWVGPRQVGTNTIAKVLDGCALTEQWRSSEGGEGRSLFYVPPRADRWRQVWVTGSALATGGTKEKTQLLVELPGGAVRFQGEIPTAGGSYLDRTTLTPNPDGTVRQLIEVSTDRGMTWRTVFDAIYRPAGG